MKLLIQPIFLLFSIASIGQTQKTTTVKLSTGDCRKDEAYSWHGADTILFYSLPKDTIRYRIIPGQYKRFPIKIENVIVGNYKLIYKNNFGQIVIKKFLLADQKSNSIVICPDILLEYQQNTLSKLQDKDSISIRFSSQGCFHATIYKLLINKEGDNYLARLYNLSGNNVTKGNKTTMQVRGDSLLKTVALTPKNIKDFIRFENELNFVSGGGCTTVDWYDIKGNYLNIKAVDASCSWNGFYYLRKSFFGD